MMKMKAVLMEKHSGSSQTLCRKSLNLRCFFFGVGFGCSKCLSPPQAAVSAAVIDDGKSLVSLRFYLLMLLLRASV